MPLICFVCILIAAIGWSFSNIASKQASTQASLKVTQQRSTVSLASPTNQKNKVSALSALALVVWGGLIACVVLTISSLIFETDAWQLATFTQVPVKSWLSIGFIVYISTLIGFGLWALGTFAQSKYRLQGYAICFTSAGIRYGNVSATLRRSCNMVEDVGNAIDLVRAVTNKCENRQKAATGLILTTSVHKES